MVLSGFIGCSEASSKDGLTDQELVDADKEALDITAAVAGGDLQAVSQAAITLPLTGANGATISWESDSALISISGEAAKVTRPDASGANTAVTLTATISKGSASVTKPFTLTVLKISAITGAISYSVSNITYGAGAAYGVTVGTAITGIDPVYTISSTPTSTDITIDASTGKITVAPTLNAGTYSTTVSITSTGTSGEIAESFDIVVVPARLSGSLSFKDQTVRAGEAATLTGGKISFGGLIAGTDYTVRIKPLVVGMSIADNGEITIPNSIATTDAGIYTVWISGVGNYTGGYSQRFNLYVLSDISTFTLRYPDISVGKDAPVGNTSLPSWSVTHSDIDYTIALKAGGATPDIITIDENGVVNVATSGALATDDYTVTAIAKATSTIYTGSKTADLTIGVLAANVPPGVPLGLSLSTDGSGNADLSRKQ